MYNKRRTHYACYTVKTGDRRSARCSCEATGRTKTYYVREAILKYIDDLEDQYLAMDRLEHPEKHWTLEELEQGRDLES